MDKMCSTHRRIMWNEAKNAEMKNRIHTIDIYETFHHQDLETHFEHNFPYFFLDLALRFVWCGFLATAAIDCDQYENTDYVYFVSKCFDTSIHIKKNIR